ncbi:MAG: hypothetical protein LUE31_00020 [Lachnospiraceae bacterium]|nr:hypothetical protein [Lachnospiraceae bacterium]
MGKKRKKKMKKEHQKKEPVKALFFSCCLCYNPVCRESMCKAACKSGWHAVQNLLAVMGI